MNETKPTIDELVFTYARRLRISLLGAWGIPGFTTESYSPQDVIDAGDAVRARFAKLETERDDLLAACVAAEVELELDARHDPSAQPALDAVSAAIDKARGNDVPTDA